MKITEGYYRCRNGSKARVLCTDAPGDCPVVGYIEREESPYFTQHRWTSEGRCINYEEQTHRDLIEPWRDEPEQTVTLSLSKLRELLIQASSDVGEDEPLTKEEADDWLIEEGILPAPAKQLVRVSGWAIVGDAGVIRVEARRESAEAYRSRVWPTAAVVYVTGTEGVGPEDDSTRGGQ